MSQNGYTLVCPNIALPSYGLSDEQQVRCLSYLGKYLLEFGAMPSSATVEVIAAQYYGGPWPAIGVHLEDPSQIPYLPSPFLLESRLNSYIAEIGIDQLLQLSAHETLTWQDVLHEHLN